MIVHEDARRDVHGGDQDEPFAYPGGGSAFLHLVGNVDYLLPLPRIERQVGRVSLHSAQNPEKG